MGQEPSGRWKVSAAEPPDRAELYLRRGLQDRATTHAIAAREAGETLPEALQALLPTRS